MRPGPIKQRDEDELEEERLASQSKIPEDANIEKMIMMPTWREMLYDLVHTQQLDPWNIDVAEITNKYIETLRKMQTNDLRPPANLILAAAILLRFKSDLLSLDEPVMQETLEGYIEEAPLRSADIPTLELAGRIPPKGRVTLDELVGALEKVFSDQKARAEKKVEIPIPEGMKINIGEFNIDHHIKAVHDKILERKDSQNLVTFSSLLDERTRKGVVLTLLPLLFLSQRGTVSLAQDPFFGEIFITVIENKVS